MSDLKPNTTYRVSFRLGKNTRYGNATTTEDGKICGVRDDKMNGIQHPTWVKIIREISPAKTSAF